jgi:hypothetical protein
VGLRAGADCGAALFFRPPAAADLVAFWFEAWRFCRAVNGHFGTLWRVHFEMARCTLPGELPVAAGGPESG